jgi:hypothetical protein
LAFFASFSAALAAFFAAFTGSISTFATAAAAALASASLIARDYVDTKSAVGGTDVDVARSCAAQMSTDVLRIPPNVVVRQTQSMDTIRCVFLRASFASFVPCASPCGVERDW